MKTFVLLAAAAVILGGAGAQGQEKLKIGILPSRRPCSVSSFTASILRSGSQRRFAASVQ